MSERTNPYVGLRPFLKRDSLYFFGREDQTSELLQILHRQRFLGIVGSSGSGKSSLVRAGLLPALLGGFLVEERSRWRVIQVKPGDAPMANLAKGLVDAVDENASAQAVRDVDESIRENLADGVLEYLAARRDGDEENVFILVDQFEEIFAFRRMTGADGTDASDPDLIATSTHQVQSQDEADAEQARARERAQRRGEAADFVAMLMALAEQRDQHIYVAITMRTDFLGDCDLFYGFPEALNKGQYLVPRLTRQQLRRAIEGPAKLMGARFAPRLMDHLLNELGDRSDRLPVLQHALLRTWDKWAEATAAGHEGPIDLEHFDKAGGLENALNQDAEEALEGLDAGITERVFRRLTDTDLSQRRVRSPARVSELVASSGSDRGRVEGIIRQFEQHGRNFVYESPDGRPDDPRVDISHESLIRQWRRLREWVDRERDARDRFKGLLDRARKWKQGDTGLLQGPELRLQTTWQREQSPTPGWARRYSDSDSDFTLATDYLQRSVRGDKQRLLKVGAVTAALVAVTALAATAIGQRGKALDALAGAEAQRLTSTAVAVLEGKQSGGLELTLMALIAAYAMDSTSPTVRGAVFAATRMVPRIVHVVNTSQVSVAAFSNDRSRIAVGGRDGGIRIYDSSLVLLHEIPDAHAGMITQLAFDADGTRLVSSAEDSLAHVWNAETGDSMSTLPVNGIWHVSLSGGEVRYSAIDPALMLGAAPDTAGTAVEGYDELTVVGAFGHTAPLFVTGASDRTIRVWDVGGRQPTQLRAFKTHRSIDNVFVGGGDSLVAIRTSDGYVELFNINTGEAGVRLGQTADATSPDSGMTSVGFSPDNISLVVGRQDGVIRVTEIRGGTHAEQHHELKAYVGGVVAVTLNADASRALVVGLDGISVVDVTLSPTVADPVVAGGGDGPLAYNSHDSTIIVKRSGGQIGRWHLGSRRESAGPTASGTRGISRALAVSKDGTLLAEAADDGTRLFNLVTGDSIRRFSTRYTGPIAFSPDGGHLAEVAGADTLFLWDVKTGKAAWSKGIPTPMSIAFSDDGRVIATAGADSAIHFWSATDGTLMQSLPTAHFGAVAAIAFSPFDMTLPSRLVSGGEDGVVRIWDKTSGSWGLVAEGEGHTYGITALAFSPDGHMIATGSPDGSVRRWDAIDLAPLGAPYLNLGYVQSLVFAGTDQIVAMDLFGSFHVLPTVEPPPDELCRKLTRELSPSLWRAIITPGLKPRRGLCR